MQNLFIFLLLWLRLCMCSPQTFSSFTSSLVSLSLSPPLSSHLCILQLLLPQSAGPQLLLLSELSPLLVRYYLLILSFPPAASVVFSRRISCNYIISLCTSTSLLLLCGTLFINKNTAVLPRMTFPH